MRRVWAEDCATGTKSWGLGYWASLNEFEKINAMEEKNIFSTFFSHVQKHFLTFIFPREHAIYVA
jgi:hypothetical protein